MAKHSSPTLVLTISEEQREEAINSNSGGCLIADAIKKQYPHLSGIIVDMATVRVSDREQGLRYTYLTPPGAQHCLLAFDQGWPNPSEQVTIKRAVKIHPITRPKTGPASTTAVAARRAERVATLTAKRDSGQPLTRGEKTALTRMSKAAPPVDRPTSNGPTEVHVTDGGSSHGAVVIGGRGIPQGPAHPNLLRGRDRHFGARLADPGQAFTEAVEAAVQERLASGGAR